MNVNLVQTVPKGENVRNRLIEAAGQIFAEMGYEAATVRQITDRAQVNIAAVNYYFGDKLQLYRTVLELVTGITLRAVKQQCIDGSAETRLRRFVSCILRATPSEDYPWARLLMAREITELHGAQAVVIVEAVRPMHEIAESIVTKLLGKQADPPLAKRAASLLVSVSVNYLPQQRLDQKINAGREFIEIDMETAIDELSRFIFAGVKALAKSKNATIF